MVQASVRVLALLTASATMLLGMPLLSLAAWGGDQQRPAFAAAPAEQDAAGESAFERFEEEREDEPETRPLFLAGRLGGEPLASLCLGVVGHPGRVSRPVKSHGVLPIRGPPAG